MMRKVLSLISFIFLLGTMSFSGEIDSLLNQLDFLMKSRPQLQAAKESELKNMKGLLKEAKGKPEQIYYITKQIIQNYIPYRSDSALFYIDKNLILAKQIKNPNMLNETRLFLAQILTSTGQYTEAVDVIADIDRATLSENLLIEYYYRNGKLYSDLELNSKYKEKKQKYDKLYQSYSDSLVKILDPDSDYYLELTEKN